MGLSLRVTRSSLPFGKSARGTISWDLEERSRRCKWRHENDRVNRCQGGKPLVLIECGDERGQGGIVLEGPWLMVWMIGLMMVPFMKKRVH